MTQITPNLNLTVWNNISDPYDSGELVDNFVKLDVHDHSGSGKGVKLDASQSIIAGSITGSQLQPNSVNSSVLASDNTTDSNRSVTTDHIRDGAITRSKLRNLANNNATPIFISAGSALPGSGTVIAGDEVYYETTSGGALWHLRWNGTLWNFIGGPSLSSTQYTDGTDTSSTATYGGLTSCTVASVTVPLAGTYEIYHWAEVSMATQDDRSVCGSIGLNVNNAASDNHRYVIGTGANGTVVTGSRTVTLTATANNFTFYCLFRRGSGTTGTLTVTQHGLYVKPVTIS